MCLKVMGWVDLEIPDILRLFPGEWETIKLGAMLSGKEVSLSPQG